MEPVVVPLYPARRPSAWRRTIGGLLRAAREARGQRLVDVAARARLSPQYLSEVERGLKEPSSEVLAAVTDALGLTLVDLAQGIADALGTAPTATSRQRAGHVVRSLSSAPGHVRPATPSSRAGTVLAA